MEEKSIEDRTAISFLSCFTSLSSYPSASFRNLLRAFSDELTPRDLVPLAQEPAVIANRRAGERELRTLLRSSGDDTIYPFHIFSRPLKMRLRI